MRVIVTGSLGKIGLAPDQTIFAINTISTYRLFSVAVATFLLSGEAQL